ncbi:MAG: DNA-binding protein [Desulfuromonadales bacterium GWC2_61_20]|nr:MAG: DNA-binding protein [Desulfuromonadales bacterium GWC2_61_20]
MLVPVERIETSILFVRGHKVILDSDLAELYGVEIRVLNQSVKRNAKRFPPDFMFQLDEAEYADCEALRSQFVILKGGRGQHRKFAPFAFTEQGVAMLSSVLNSDRAIEVNIQIMRTFVKLREMIASNAELARRLEELEQKYDAQFSVVFDAIRKMMTPTTKPNKSIGFQVEEDGEVYH